MSFMIFGGCATRDIFDIGMAKDFGLEFRDYYARSSPASAFCLSRDTSLTPDYSKIASNFQRRCVERDIKKHLVSSLDKKFDYLLVDFFSVRFDIAVKESDVFTVSNVFNKTGFDYRKAGYNLVKKGTSKYVDLWTVGFENLTQIFDSKKIIINELYAAKKLEDGSGYGVEKESIIDEYNDFLNYAYTEARKWVPAANFIRYDNDVFMGALEHKWGVGPYHYIPRVYEEAARFLKELK